MEVRTPNLNIYVSRMTVEERLQHRMHRYSSSVYDLARDSIKVMSLHASKSLEFSVVLLVGAVGMTAEDED